MYIKFFYFRIKKKAIVTLTHQHQRKQNQNQKIILTIQVVKKQIIVKGKHITHPQKHHLIQVIIIIQQ